MELAPSKAVSLNGKAFRPLLCWFIVSVALLAWRHHQEQERESNIQFSVSMEGRKERPSYGATLNELSYSAGHHSGLGRKELRIQAEGAEPFVTNLFIWYGGKNLGHIELARSRGTLELTTTPIALRIEVGNQETNTVFYNSTGRSLTLPIGSYKVVARFERFGTVRNIEIKAHHTNALLIDPGLTALRVDSQPTDAEFELSSVLPADITVLTNTPAILTDLRSGEYHLRIWRGDYEKIVPVTLRAGVGTNELKVEFDYARLTLHSEPSGATIREGEKILGTTPISLTRPTGLIRLTVAKEGFSSTNLELTLQAKEERTVELTLLNRAYGTALEQAREHSSGFSPDFNRALEEVNRALQNKSGDATALALRQSIMFQVHLRDARDFQRQREVSQALGQVDLALQINASDAGALDLKRVLEQEKQAADQRQAEAQAKAQRDRPRQVFEKTVTRLRHQELFPSQQMQFKGQLAEVRAQIVEALGRKPSWSVSRNDTEEQDVAVVQAELKSFGSRQGTLLVLGQTGPNEVTVHFKLWIYTLSNNIKLGLTGLAEESFVALHPSFAATANEGNVEARRTRTLEEFRKRLELR